MKVLLFEWLTGGGEPNNGPVVDSRCSLRRQGLQMLKAITDDFLDAGIEVVVPLASDSLQILSDHPNLTTIPIAAYDNLERELKRAAVQCDHVMLIAPESDGCLNECVGWFQDDKHKLISPGLSFTKITSCKISTFESLVASQFTAFPTGLRLSDYLDPIFNQQRNDLLGEFPLVLKRIDGAGSEQIQFITNRSTWQPQQIASADQYRIESFISGTPVSVSVLCGKVSEILAPTIQIFDRSPFGSYLRADYPIDPEITRRAIRLARATIKALPPTVGYVGLDMVIRDGSEQDDCLIEVNPRLTLSYLILRKIYHDNLALAMLRLAIESRGLETASSIRDCIFRKPDL